MGTHLFGSPCMSQL